MVILRTLAFIQKQLITFTLHECMKMVQYCGHWHFLETAEHFQFPGVPEGTSPADTGIFLEKAEHIQFTGVPEDGSPSDTGIFLETAEHSQFPGVPEDGSPADIGIFL